MALLNRKVDYALLILSYLHHNPDASCARMVAARFGLSRGFVANILKRLCRHGYVASYRGIKGGYVLLPETMHVSLAELMDALDDAFQLAECNAESPHDCCPLYDGCPVKGPIAEVDRRIREVLGNVTVAELFGIAPERLACRTLELVTTS
jgi:Rrf2 family transcriptional regulator, cysteine metabolism repressor